MLTPEQAKDRAADLVRRARAKGADAADALYTCDAATEVSVRLGKLEDVQRSEGEDMGLRVFVGKRSASASTSDLSSAALDTLAERVVDMARQAPEDAYAGLAPEELLTTAEIAGFDTVDPAEIGPKALMERALAAEAAGLAVKGVTNSEGAGASAGGAVVALATSHGFAGGYAGTSHAVSATMLAGEGGGMQRDYDYHTVRHAADLDDAAEIGRSAGERAVARLDPIKLKSGEMPVVFDPRTGATLLGHFVGAISGPSIARKTSFLLDRLGEQVFAAGIRIIDDPHRMRGLRSRPFDGEGLPTARRALIEGGVLTGWLLDSASARQLGLAPTGNASRGGGGPPGVTTTNLHLEAGAKSAADLIGGIDDGFYVTELIGQGVNGLTGDYSRGAMGFRIENGRITAPVAEVTIAGNLKDMFLALTPANDLCFRYATNTPTLLIEGMTVAGD